MPDVPLHTEVEQRDNAAFEALLWALSRPGTCRDLPRPGEETMIAALLDRECSVFCADARLLPRVMDTGAQVTGQETADYLFLGDLSRSDSLGSVKVGSDLYPDEGATVVVRARIGVGDRLRLTGPGVDGTLEVRVSGLPGGFWQNRLQMNRYPMGFDLFLVEGTTVMGLPRSTMVEVI